MSEHYGKYWSSISKRGYVYEDLDIESQIKHLEINIQRVEQELDDYGNNEMVLIRWRRELKILKIESET